jgi:hypothetical protein
VHEGISLCETFLLRGAISSFEGVISFSPSLREAVKDFIFRKMLVATKQSHLFEAVYVLRLLRRKLHSL